MAADPAFASAAHTAPPPRLPILSVHDRAHHTELLPDLDMPRAFADHLARFPFPPDWAQHPADAPLDMITVISHRPEVLKRVLANFCAVLPGASLTIVHGPRNAAWVREELLQGWDPARHPGVRTLQLLPDADFAVQEYNKLMLSPAFWASLKDRQRVLIFQPDTLLLRNTVLDFMNERFVGAPWARSWHYGTGPEEGPPVGPECYVGNGGLSLREPRLMAAACRHPQIASRRGQVPEDIALARLLGPGRTAHPLRARRFAVEGCPFAVPMGVHKAWRHLDAFHLQEMLQCAPPPPEPNTPLPRVWERPWRLLDARGEWPELGAPLPEPQQALDAAARMPEVTLREGERAQLNAWIRLGTNYRGFFCDEGAAVPVPQPEPAPAAAPALAVAWLLLIPTQGGAAAMLISAGGICLRRCWES
jgi:hypothetical protein